MNTQEYIEKVKTQTNDEYEVLGEYINCDTPIEMKHKVCGYVWNTTTTYCFTRKNKPNRCPQCFKNRRVSVSYLVQDVHFVMNQKVKSQFKNPLMNLILVMNNRRFLMIYINQKLGNHCLMIFIYQNIIS